MQRSIPILTANQTLIPQPQLVPTSHQKHDSDLEESLETTLDWTLSKFTCKIATRKRTYAIRNFMTYIARTHLLTTPGSFHVRSMQKKCLIPSDLNETWFVHSVYRDSKVSWVLGPLPSIVSELEPSTMSFSLVDFRFTHRYLISRNFGNNYLYQLQNTPVKPYKMFFCVIYLYCTLHESRVKGHASALWPLVSQKQIFDFHQSWSEYYLNISLWLVWIWIGTAMDLGDTWQN